MLRTIVAVAMLAVAALMSGGLAATSNAAPTQTADQLMVKYNKLSLDAETSAEAMHNAELEYDKQRKALTVARAASLKAQQTLDVSQKNLAAVQARVNKVVRASYRGARINRLYAVLVSDSPQNLLDQMSGLELVSRQSAADLRKLKASRRTTLAAKKTADDSAATATTAIAAVEKTRGQLQVERANLNLQAVRIRAIYESMTGKQLAELRGPKFDFDPRLVPKGTSAALVAVQAALTRIGDAYVWGATGPNTFDCSGLMVWAYKQAGQTLPRSSEAQQASGKAVSRDQLQPGDLIIYYSDAHHVGMYVGDGYVIHASTFGVPVKVVPIDKAGPYQSARRYA
ncbi:C40 family peptidase [Gordonia sp. TBRC 11910]|uniref:C40 family peptidase n=1 Tax=Gordonia asplenii TaxID=2725283 RepID=A0A848KX32_9ACTN|nr:C40 family peptidase [Gordonia asplenii]NMO03354.1 C40 family peptidase [Gordonia asplenii]